MLLTVWIVVAVLAVLVLGVLAYSLVGALGRLSRELRGLERDVQPVLAEMQATAARAQAQAQARAEAAQRDERPASAAPPAGERRALTSG